MQTTVEKHVRNAIRSFEKGDTENAKVAIRKALRHARELNLKEVSRNLEDALKLLESEDIGIKMRVWRVRNCLRRALMRIELSELV
jgi:hypothetical protein